MSIHNLLTLGRTPGLMLRRNSKLFCGALLLLLIHFAPTHAQQSSPGSTGDRGVMPRPSAIYREYVDRWAIIVGISKYKDERLNLDYAHRDAEELFKLLHAPSGGGYEQDNILQLVNERATTAAVTHALRTFLKKPARKDIVFLYFTAHGTPDLERPNNIYSVL